MSKHFKNGKNQTVPSIVLVKCHETQRGSTHVGIGAKLPTKKNIISGCAFITIPDFMSDSEKHKNEELLPY